MYNGVYLFLSSPVSSSTHAKANDALPTLLDSFSYLQVQSHLAHRITPSVLTHLCIVFLETCPSLYSICPISVLLPASTCPIYICISNHSSDPY